MLKRVKKVQSIIVILTLLLGLLPISNVQRTNADSVYYIYSVEDLYDVRNHLSDTVYLMNDIDLTTATAPGGDYDFEGKGWKPIGIADSYTSGVSFSGKFLGQNHTISGMRIESDSLTRAGLFYEISGTVQDLNVQGYIKTASPICAAGGITYSLYNGKIINCNNYVKINTYGGIAGGIVSYNTQGQISKCANHANIEVIEQGSGYLTRAAGIVGWSDGGSISYCYNANNIIVRSGCNGSNSDQAAGIVSGRKDGSSHGYGASVNDCYNQGDIILTNGYSNRYSAAGIQSSAKISTVYDVENVTHCYNIGNVRTTSSGGTVNNNCYAISPSSTESYYLNTLAAGDDQATALTESQMKNQSMFNGFDFATCWVIDKNTAYKYPQLRSNRQFINKEITSVELVNSPSKTRYYTQDVLKLDGGIIKVYYVDGSSEIKEMTDEMLIEASTNYTSSSGFKNVYIYPDKKDNPEKACYFEIEVVTRPTATLMTLLSEPNQKVFVQNTAFDFTGCQVQIAYDNGDIEVRDIDASMTTGGSISTIGTQTIQYKLNTLSVQFTIEVIPLSVTSIVVETKPNKLTYLEGESFKPAGMVVRAYLNDGSDRLVDDYTYSGYSSEPGTHTITVEYSGCTDTFDVVVNEKTAKSIKVTKYPTKTTYVQGQEIDPDGMEVTAYYNNGTNSVITGYTIDKPTMDTGVQTVAVRYGSLTTYIPITVIARQATGLFVTSPPNKTTYVEGTDFDDTGLVIAASFNDGITESVEDYELAGVDTSTVGSKVVTVMYQGLTTTFELNVVAKSLESIRILDKGKDSYLVGEELDTSDLIVEAYYDNGTHETVNDYAVSGFTGEVGDNVITVNYQGKKINYVVKVHEPDDEWTVTKEATCTEKGERVKYCKHCGAVAIKEEIDKLGHTAVPDLAKEATCTEAGLTAGSHCDTCGAILVAQEVIPAKGHTPSEDWELVKDSTCLDEGSQVRRCTTCHEIVDTNVIAAKGHKLVTDEAVAATCTESGLTEGLHCEVCDEVIQAQTIIQPLGHVEAEEWTVTKSPTCTVAGTRVKKCAVCGHILKTEIIDPTGHSFKNYVSNNDATCTEDGTKTAKCEHCSETKTITDVNSAKGHKVVYDKAVAATCTESGLTAGSHCSECHEILQKQEVVAPKGHKESSRWTVSKEPTCTEKGVEVCKCVECDEVLDSRKIEAKGHTEVVDGAIEATCIDTGLTEGKHCHVCGEVLVAQKVIPAKGHHEVVDKKIDATCEKTGLTQGSHCDVCSEILEKQEVIPAKGHSTELKHVSQATYFDEGYTGDKVCNICGQVLEYGEPISKLHVPKAIVKFKKGKKKITLKFTKQKNITKYEIRIKKGKKWKVYFTNKKTYKLKKLKKKKKYTIKVRALIIRDSRTAYSQFITKKVKTK